MIEPGWGRWRRRLLRVVGGDSFPRVRVDKGIDVVVNGYTGEPFLGIQADGTVRGNQNSPAYLDNDRYARTQVPEGVDGKGAPQGKIVGQDGEHIWYGHRIHWISPSAPTLTDGDKITVDGRAVTVAGTPTLLGAPSPLPYLGLAVIVGGAVTYFGWRCHGLPGAGGTPGGADHDALADTVDLDCAVPAGDGG